MKSLLISSILFPFAFGFKCCNIHQTAANCAAEIGVECVWLSPDDDIYTSGASGGDQCVTKRFIECETTFGTGALPCNVPEPSASNTCELEECVDNSRVVNVGIALDESGSVGGDNYDKSLDFISNIIRKDLNDVSQVSVVAFSDNLDRIYSFTDAQNDERTGVLAAINDERKDYFSGWTCTKTAIDAMVNDFATTPGISPSDNNVLLLVTDGKPNCGGDVCDSVAALKEQGIKVFIVGVSSGFDPKQVNCLVDDPPNDIVAIPDFTAELFFRAESRTRSVVCPVGSSTSEALMAKVSKMVFGVNELNMSTLMLWVALIVSVVIALAYWNRKGICDKKGDYQPLMEGNETNTV